MFDMDMDQDEPKKLPSINDVLAHLMGSQSPATAAPQGQPTLDAAMRVNSPAAQPEQPKPDMTDQAMRAPMPTGAPQSGMSQLNDIANVRPNIPAPPLNPNTPSLMKEKAAVSTPIDRRDPQYKMGTGQRVLGTVANFLNGAARNGAAPVEVGPGANNNKYYRDEEARQGKVSGLNSQITDNEKLDEMNRQAFQTAAQAQERSDIGRRNLAQADKYENAVDPKSIHQDSEGKWVGSTYGGKEQEVDEPQYARAEGRKSAVDANTPSKARPFQKNDPATGQPAWFVKSADGKNDLPFTPKNDQEAMQIGDKAAIARFYYAHREKGKNSAENNPELNGFSPAEQRDFKNRTRQNDLKMKSLIDSRKDALLRPWANVDPKAIDAQLSDLQSERDQVRTDILSNRKGRGPSSAHAAPQPKTQTQYTKFAKDDNGRRLGYNSKSKQWEPVAGTQ